MSGTAKGGNDLLISGSGTDHMWGDAAVLSGSATGGHDTFMFKDGFGTDFVYDFHQHQDLMVFSGDDVNRFRDLDITMSGSDTVITVSPTDIVTLVGYDNTLHPLTAHDFLFT
jgi:Ca2+-binding RTX toxin-like protein